MRTGLSIILLSVSFLAVSCSAGETKLPKPSGKYYTGIEYLALTDENRLELFDNSNTKKRELTIKVWYPADELIKVAPYLEDAERIISEFQFAEEYRTLKSNSSRGVNVSKMEKSFPVLIFSHGWGEHFSQNTILMEELASHGYIVFSVAHHYECKFSLYPAGRFISLDVNSRRFNSIMNEQQNPKAMEVFQKMATASDDGERNNVFIEINTLLPTLLVESPNYWKDDVLFVINQLKLINETHAIFKGRLELNSIGVFGMSMGGLAANEVCINGNVKAGINIDGGLNGSVVNEKIKTPFLFINSSRYLNYENLFTSKVMNNGYAVTVKNSGHYNFTDYALYPNSDTNQLGGIEPSIPIDILNKLTVAFFDKYMKEDSTNSIEQALESYQNYIQYKIPHK